MKHLKIMLSLIVCFMLTISCFAFTGCGKEDESGDSGSTSAGGKLDDIFGDYFGDSGSSGGDGDSGDVGGEEDEDTVTFEAGVVVLEAEHAEFVNNNTQGDLRIEQSQYVAYFRNNNALVFTFTCNKAESNVKLTMHASSCIESGSTLLAISAEDAAKLVVVNETGTLNNPTGEFEGSDTQNWYNMCDVSGYIDLVEGVNVVSIVCYGDIRMNFDYIQLETTEASISWVPNYNW